MLPVPRSGKVKCGLFTLPRIFKLWSLLYCILRHTLTEDLERDSEELRQDPDDVDSNELKTVMVRMRKESDRSAAYAKRSHAFLKEQEDREEWQDLAVFGKDVRGCCSRWIA